MPLIYILYLIKIYFTKDLFIHAWDIIPNYFFSSTFVIDTILRKVVLWLKLWRAVFLFSIKVLRNYLRASHLIMDSVFQFSTYTETLATSGFHTTINPIVLRSILQAFIFVFVMAESFVTSTESWVNFYMCVHVCYVCNSLFSFHAA